MENQCREKLPLISLIFWITTVPSSKNISNSPTISIPMVRIFTPTQFAPIFTPILVWVCQFKWAAEKYPSRMSLPELVKVINTSLTEIDQVLKKKSSSYNAMRSKLAQFEKKSTSSLVTRPLNDIIKVVILSFFLFLKIKL